MGQRSWSYRTTVLVDCHMEGQPVGNIRTVFCLYLRMGKGIPPVLDCKKMTFLTELRELEAQVPDEPLFVTISRQLKDENTRNLITHIDTLLDLLRRESADKVIAEDYARLEHDRAEAAESKLAALNKEQSWKERIEIKESSK